MRKLLTLGLAFGLTAGAESGRAADRAAALAVIEKAVKAQGGAEGLARAALASRGGKGVLSLPGSDLTFTTEEVLNLPGQLRIKNEANGKQIVYVINGDKGWLQSAGGMTTEMTRDRLGERQEEAYVWWLATLAPLLKDGFDLDVLPDTKVDNRPAAGVKVSSRGRPEAQLYFDKENGQLVKIARRAKENGIELNKEYFYSDYKELDGIKLPSKEVVHLNGRKFSEVQYTEYKLLRKSDDSAFGRP